MNTFKSSERRPGTEGLSTLSTFIMTLNPCVNSLVASEVTTGTEEMKTLVTFTGLFPSVNYYVKCKGLGVTKCLPTVIAFKWFLHILECFYEQ